MRVGINGFGRIGRQVLRLLEKDKTLDVVAINSRGNAEEYAYLYKYDSAQRTLNSKISYNDKELIIANKHIKVFSYDDPAEIPWGKLKVDVVFECTGVFLTEEDCMKHINAGAKHVVISAPSKSDVPTYVYGVNTNCFDVNSKIISTASCTTNALAPVLDLINKKYGVVKGYMTTVHAMTNDQEVLDVRHKKGIKSRRGRCASQNIIPTSTGAASSIGKVIPSLNGKLDGISLRVPVCDGSVIDLTVEISKNTTIEEVNNMFKSNQTKSLKFTLDPIVSCDIIGNTCGAMVDGLLTNIVEVDGKQLLKVIAWYDNEIGYSAGMIRVARLFDK